MTPSNHSGRERSAGRSRLESVRLGLIALLATAALSACGAPAGSDGYNGYFPTFPLSGRVTDSATGAGVANVTMTLSGDGSGTTHTDTDGNYTFGHLLGKYNVTPSISGGTFTPASRSVTVADSQVTGQDFVLTQSGTGASTPSRAHLASIASLAAYAGAVYSRAGGILSARSASGAESELARGEQAGSTAEILADAHAVYWVRVSDPGCGTDCEWIIERVPHDGGTRQTLAVSRRPIVALAGDAGHLYWEESLPAAAATPGSVVRVVAKSGGPPSVLVDETLNGALSAAAGARSWVAAGSLALSAGRVIFGVAGDSYCIEAVAPEDRTITTLGCAASRSSTPAEVIGHIRTDELNAYWIDRPARTLDSVALAGGEIEVRARDLEVPETDGAPLELQLTPTSAYWLESHGIAALPLGGGRTVRIADAQQPSALALDDTRLLWGESGQVLASVLGSAYVPGR